MKRIRVDIESEETENEGLEMEFKISLRAIVGFFRR